MNDTFEAVTTVETAETTIAEFTTVPPETTALMVSETPVTSEATLTDVYNVLFVIAQLIAAIIVLIMIRYAVNFFKGVYNKILN